MSRKALGRGLSALLQEVETSPQVAPGLEQIPIELIDPNPFQPRRTFPEETLKELSDSIRATGLVQPVLLRKLDSRYQLVAGERRWRAAHLADLVVIPAIVRPLGDEQALELALTENLLREDLNPLEVAHAYRSLQDQFHLSHEQIAERLGVSRTAVTNTLRLLRLPPEVQELITKGDLSAGHARPLLALAAANDQVEAARVILRRNLSVRQAEQWVASRNECPSTARESTETAKIDPNIKAAIRELERTLGTRVRIVGEPDSGRIEIRYYSAEDLNRIYQLIVGQSQGVKSF